MERLFTERDGNRIRWWVGEHRNDEHPITYYTNSDGEGIFLFNRKTWQERQLVGTCQFSVYGLKNPHSKIRRWMIARFLLLP